MKKHPDILSPTAKKLRTRAEKRLRMKQKAAGQARPITDTQRLVQELQIHQIELELQNAELQRARIETERALDKYTELYDFAPVGYFSIDQQGLIQEANLMGAAMLGAVRTQLLKRPLQAFVAPTSRPMIDAFLKSVFASPGKHACEAQLLTATDTPFWADLQCVSTAKNEGDVKACRLAIFDIASLKRGHKALCNVKPKRQKKSAAHNDSSYNRS